MKMTSALGVASTLFRSKKMKIVLVGLQLTYMGYKYYKSKKKSIVAADNRLKLINK